MNFYNHRNSGPKTTKYIANDNNKEWRKDTSEKCSETIQQAATSDERDSSALSVIVNYSDLALTRYGTRQCENNGPTRGEGAVVGLLIGVQRSCSFRIKRSYLSFCSGLKLFPWEQRVAIVFSLPS
ncbi:hypothetical protein LOAG_04247 [Loa loa]|uniref:Uncharacterized protein n=1 Tax=Loa loa TaxID=7209 RepID=A0A1S0U2T4_LOALO|nr:hypothetical protein LOAG_04247 [Loa loa]EFO24240.1 hypothetical protein LOAG_04247 [Loa loa]